MDVRIEQALAEARLLGREHWRPLLAYAGIGVLLPF